jgi:hypothetical protein
MNKKRYRKLKQSGLLTLLLFVAGFTFAQQHEKGKVTVYADQRIGELIELHKEYNETFPLLDGYRIQLFMETGNDALLHAERVKEQFEERYDRVPVYITFGEPYYRVRIGDFRTRLEAQQFLEKINRKYPNAWVIQDKINLPPLRKTNKSYDHE